MDPVDREHLLRELAQLAERPDGPLPADEVLAAFRAGRLSEAEAARVEAVLARHPAARERLAALAGLAPRQPGREVRERVLAAVGGGGRAARRRRLWPWGLAAAAALAAVIAIPLLGPRGPAGPLPEYRLEIAAPSELRGGPGGGRKFHADQPVPLAVVPVDQAEAGVEFGLYRVAGGRLERLAPSADLRFQIDRGTATLRAPAARLAGTAPGTYELFIVATLGELPAGRVLAPGEDARRVLSAEPGRRVLVDHIDILGPP